MEVSNPLAMSVDDELLDLLDLSLNEEAHESYTELTLVGCIIADRILNFKAVKSILYSSWNLGSNVSISLVEPNKFSCTFNTAIDRDRILHASPWAVKGHIVVLKSWSPSVTLSEIVFTQSPFWVQIHNIPPNRQNLANAKKLGDFIGEFVDLDNSQPLKNFLRILVLINTTKPLKTGTFIKRENGLTWWLAFKFERLSDFCFRCGKLGHTFTSCSLPQPDSEGVLDPRLAYGSWMRASSMGGRDSARPHSFGSPAPSSEPPNVDREASCSDAINPPQGVSTVPAKSESLEARIPTQHRNPLADISNLVAAPSPSHFPPGNSVHFHVSNSIVNFVVGSSSSNPSPSLIQIFLILLWPILLPLLSLVPILFWPSPLPHLDKP